MDRRTFLSMTTVTGTALVAGCGGSTDDGGPTAEDGTAGGNTDTTDSSSTGRFRLLVSDRPADIDDFDALDVTFDRARVHREQSETEETEVEETGDVTEAEETGTVEDTERESEGRETESGFTVFDLDEPTVDLTQVVGEKAIGVLDGTLETGQYSKIELYVSDVEGIVDGASVPVTVPSGKLQITHSFEITADGTVEFVFDINVVKRGLGGYNLLPVISESGVAGEDVAVEEVEADDEPPAEPTPESGTATAGTDA
ncbi:DUF4382 domain-containing protein [Haloarcula sp. S1CR25-12]|uniref:DUF4382 domain-containing protein n=1 Tax=Haloarcula saliterrae TaxID=2950534 RepID=A0ABU2FF51_9EURY|nr:DUF4382 domain-containing protein [Haloarcula sp. S1CR25-12]MDS0260431.1 DUF4382 domain-containing protein [Haloarcula sp. S1CR25-12]